MVAPLRRNRDFVALWSGQTASALGTSISSLAYPLLVLELTGSAASAGLVGTVLAATTFVLRIPAGVVADRAPRKRLMLVCDAGRVVAVGSLGVAALLHELSLAHIVLVAFLEAAFGVLFAPAEAVAVRRVVHPSQVREAVATNQSRQQVAGLVGPALGGALFGVGRALPFLADALSYAVSFVTVASVRSRLQDDGRRRPPAPAGLWHEHLEGLRWLWSQRFTRFLAVWMSAAGAVFTSLGLVTVVLADELGATPAETGLAFTVAGAGGLAGALVAPRLLARLAPSTIVLGYAWIASVATFGLLRADSPLLLGVVGALAFFPVPAVNATVLARVALDAPERLQGRAVSATTQLLTLAHPVVPVLAGFAIETVGTDSTVVLAGLAFVCLAVVVTVSPTIRRGPPEAPPTA